MSQRDYVQRIVERLGRFLARLAGLRAEGAQEKALREADDAVPQLLGVDLGLIESVDAHTAVRLLGTRERVALLTRLLAEKAELLADLERISEAAALRHRITALELAADALGT